MSKTKIVAILRLESMDRAYEVEALDRAIMVGRTQDCDIVIKDNSVSRKHLEIRYITGGWNIRDLESTKGTFVNNIRVKGGSGKKLKAKDILRLGDVVLTVSFPAKKSEPAAEKAPAPASEGVVDESMQVTAAGDDAGPTEEELAASIAEAQEAQAAEAVEEAPAEEAPAPKPAIPASKPQVRPSKIIRKPGSTGAKKGPSINLSAAAAEAEAAEAKDESAEITGAMDAASEEGSEDTSKSNRKGKASKMSGKDLKGSRRGKPEAAGSKKGLIIGVAAVVLLGGAAAAYYFTSKGHTEKAPDGKTTAADTKKVDEKKEATAPAAEKKEATAPAEAPKTEEKKDAPATAPATETK